MVYSNLIVGTKPLGMWRRPSDGTLFRRYSSRGGKRIRMFIVHHAATTSDAALWASYTSLSRQLSSTYAMARNGDIYGVVPEEFKANTSASRADYEAVTIECVNEGGEPDWQWSARSFEQLARLIADVATRNGFPINRTTVIGHKEVRPRFGDGYATRCPGEWMSARLDELVALAQKFQREGSAPPPPPAEIGEVRLGSLLRLSGWTVFEDQGLTERVGTVTGDFEVVGISGGRFRIDVGGRRLWVHNDAKAGWLSAEAIEEEEIMGARDDILAAIARANSQQAAALDQALEVIRRESRPRLYKRGSDGAALLKSQTSGWQEGPYPSVEALRDALPLRGEHLLTWQEEERALVLSDADFEAVLKYQPTD